MYQIGNKRRALTSIGLGKIHLNPSTGKPQVFNEKPCKWCGSLFRPNSPCNLYCTEECADDALVNRYLVSEYGITAEEWVCMHDKQDGKCAICGSSGFKLNEAAVLPLVIDHDHITGRVRGMLCHNCNRGLGLFHDNKEDLLSAIRYLESSTTIPEGSTLK